MVILVAIVAAKVLFSAHELAMVQKQSQYYASVDTGQVRVRQ